MASKVKVFPVKSVSGSINTYLNATQVGNDETPDALNTIPIGLTAVTGRQGYIKLTETEVETTKKIQGIFTYINDSVREVLYVCDGVLYRYDDAGGSEAVTGGTFSTTASVKAAQVGSRLYIVDGVTALSYYNGTAIATTGIESAPAKIKQVISYNKRLYCNTDDSKDRVYYGGALGSDGTATNTGDFRSASPSYAGFFGFGSGREVVSFAKIGSSLYVFLKDAIKRIDPIATTGVSSALDHTSTDISNSIGCLSAQSVENVDNDVFFLNHTVYSLGEVGTYNSLRTKNVGAKVRSFFEGADQTAVANAAAIYDDMHEMYLISIKDAAAYKDTIIGYSVPYKAWFKWTGINANSFVSFIDADSVQHIYFGSDDSSASYIYELFQGLNDDGVAINKYHKTKEFDMGLFNVEKIFQFWNAQFGGTYGTSTIDFYVDGALVDTISFLSGSSSNTADGIGTGVLGTFVIGKEGNFTEVAASGTTISNDWRWHTLTSSPNGTTFQIKVSNNNLNENFEIKQYSVGYIELPLYKRSPNREV